MNNLRKNIAITFSIGCVIFIIELAFSDKGFQFESTQELLIRFSFDQLYSFVLGFSNLIYFKYLEKRDWKIGDRLKRISAGVLGSIVITVTGLFVLRLLTAVVYEKRSIEQIIATETVWNYQFGLWITLTILAIFQFIYFYNKYQKNKVTESQLVAKTESAKFESLKNQLDPHFLFNSLNVLTSLIEENPKSAGKFTTKLSKVYRYVLEQKDKDLISLEDELKFAKSYMELLKMRFEDGITFSIPETVSDPALKIVPLALQLLLENAVKHNIITSENPLRIEIYEENGLLVIQNNLNPKNSLEKSTKVGLKNIIQRYALVSKVKVEITKDSTIFKVKLPLLTQKIKIMKTAYITDSNKYIRAKKQVDDLKGFYGSAIAYCVVIPFLIYINLKTSSGHHWFWYPLFGWGLGIVIQAFTVFGYGANWEERKIRQLMNKDNF
jgi:two-component system LytT family sensor kinase